MAMLTAGVLLWACAHLFPSLAPEARARLMEKPGEKPYKGMMALILVAAILLMVFGWRSVQPEALYAAPTAGTPMVTTALMLLSFILLGAANAPSNIKRFLRHPMLTGVIVWAVAHLLANGDNRSAVLFGGLALWAVTAMFTINRRDGEWQKPDPVPLSKDAVLVVIGAVLTAVVAYFHEYLSGVPIVSL